MGNIQQKANSASPRFITPPRLAHFPISRSLTARQQRNEPFPWDMLIRGLLQYLDYESCTICKTLSSTWKKMINAKVLSEAALKGYYGKNSLRKILIDCQKLSDVSELIKTQLTSDMKWVHLMGAMETICANMEVSSRAESLSLAIIRQFVFNCTRVSSSIVECKLLMKNHELLIVASLFLASKFDDLNPLSPTLIHYNTAGKIKFSELLAAEKVILVVLEMKIPMNLCSQYTKVLCDVHIFRKSSPLPRQYELRKVIQLENI